MGMKNSKLVYPVTVNILVSLRAVWGANMRFAMPDAECTTRGRTTRYLWPNEV